MGASAVRKLATSSRPVARVGRPPRVNVPAIVEAAIEIGLEGVTLKQVADHLGVGVATLYRHISGRDELVRLAAFQLTLRRALPDRAVTHWSELATRYAESLYQSFLAEPQLINELLKGQLGPHAEVDILEQFLHALGPHGFSPEQGAQLFHAIGMVTIGAAAGQIGLNASQGTSTPWKTAVRRTLAERNPDELPLVRRVLPVTLEGNSIPWQPNLRRVLAGIAGERGEALPTSILATGRSTG